MEARERLNELINGYRVSAAITVAADLGVADLLADGPRTVDDLAATTETDADTLHRLLRALSTLEIFEELPDGRYALADLGQPLRTDAPASLRPNARRMTDPALWAAWGHLGHSIRTGENAFEALHGIDVWNHRQRHPEHNAIFNATMVSMSSEVADAVADAYDFTRVSHVVDVGGGRGNVLEAILDRHPNLTGTVFDQEHVVAQEPSATATDSVRERWSSASGSFFEEVPSADAYVLKSIVHDWADDECVAILERCREALRPGGVVLVVEQVLGRPGYEVEAAFLDLTMMVALGGRERSEAEYAALLERAGLHVNRVIDTGTRVSIIEGSAS